MIASKGVHGRRFSPSAGVGACGDATFSGGGNLEDQAEAWGADRLPARSLGVALLESKSNAGPLETDCRACRILESTLRPISVWRGLNIKRPRACSVGYSGFWACGGACDSANCNLFLCQKAAPKRIGGGMVHAAVNIEELRQARAI